MRCHMAKRIPLIGILILLGSSCTTSPHSPSGFRLPPNGDAVTGKAAFVAFGCHSCHPVRGTDLDKPAAQSAVPVVLGGAVDRQMTDGYLVTSIIYPTYALASYPKEQITRDGQS